MAYYLSTIRHLTAAQIWHRSVRIIRRRYWRLAGKRVSVPTACGIDFHGRLYQGLSDIHSAGACEHEIACAIERAEAVSRQDFSFLQRRVSFAGDIRWHDPQLSQLWRYHLHYFDYLRDVLVWAAGGGAEPAYRTFRQLALSWIQGNQKLTGDGWHPYTLSLRVVNWLNALSFFEKELAADAGTAAHLVNSTYAQARILYSNLEFDVRGNHLIENLRALIWAGLAFKGAEPQRWLKRGVHLLELETAEQILADGGHFERSPGYHLRVFKELFEIAVWLRRNDQAPLPWLEDALRRMWQYLWNILGPDGHVPLLKDSTWNGDPSPYELLAACAIYFDEPSWKVNHSFGLYPLLIFGAQGLQRFNGWPVNHSTRQSAALYASGHFVMRDRAADDYLILDVGKTCPDYLPAHAQADTLTYELSLGSQRVIVDSGVYEYASGIWRDYFRSTRAHNTVEVAGENQSEVWASFRVGRRAQPGPAFWQARDGYVLTQGEHDGYRRLPVSVIHQRTVVYAEEKFWLIVDQLWGAGATETKNYIHLYPDLSLDLTAPSTWRISGGRVPLWLGAFGQDNFSITCAQTEPVHQGWYSEKFGELKKNLVLSLHKSGALPLAYGYVLSRQTPEPISVIAVPGGHEISFGAQEANHSLRLVRGEAPRFS